MNDRHFAAIILAAGFSHRMQCFKPLLNVGNETITDHLINIFTGNQVEVTLVVGHKQNDLRAGIKSQHIRIVENVNYHKGMFTSIQAGLLSLQPGFQGVFIMPVDIPLVRPFTVHRLLMAAEECPEKIIYPVFNQRRGHPALIPAHLVPSILKWQEDGGLKTFLHKFKSDSLEIEVPDSNILFDIDNPEDYQILLKRFQLLDIPTKEECDVIIKKIHCVSPSIYSHCSKVAEVAITISRALEIAGENINLPLVHAAAILHDIAKGQPKHDAAGALMIHKLGFSKVAEIIATHTNLPEENQRPTLESRVVYLSDKLVTGDVLVPIEERYRRAILRFGESAGAKSAILNRRERTLSVKVEIESLLGCSLDKLLFC